MKNGRAQVYWPSLGINQIGEWQLASGYQLYMQSPSLLSVQGTACIPQAVPASLSSGWNLIAYLRNSPLACQSALAGIATNLILAKSGTGLVYWPAFGINTLGSMQTGQGYQVYVNQACVLTYPANSLSKELSLPGTSFPSCVHFTESARLTGSNAVVLWRNLPFANGDEIAAYAGSDRLVGSSVVHNGQALLILWGDDAISGLKDGASENEALYLRMWSRNEDTESEIQPVRIVDALIGQPAADRIRYAQDCALVLEGVQDDEAGLALDYQLAQNYPNPFNPATIVRFLLPKAERVTLAIFNARGERIRLLVDEVSSRGAHSIVWNGMDDLDHVVPGGIYFLRMSCESFDKVVKMSFIK